MNLLTQFLHLVGSGAVAYVTARNLRDLQTRPDLLAGYQMAESGSVPFLEALKQRAIEEGNEWLAAKLERHAADERRHGQIFAQALKQLNKQVIDFKAAAASAESQPNSKKQSSDRRSPFFSAYFEGYEQKDLSPAVINWTVFFASTYILELDACKDFARMATALPETDTASLNLKKGLLSIAKDEEGHAAYLLEALHRQLPYAEVTALVDRWRTRKVDAMLAMVGNLLQRGGKFPSMAQDGVPVEMSETVSTEISPAKDLAIA